LGARPGARAGVLWRPPRHVVCCGGLARGPRGAAAVRDRPSCPGASSCCITRGRSRLTRREGARPSPRLNGAR
jgi:hypothetical protein